jgi:methionyl-tRNA synthetase
VQDNTLTYYKTSKFVISPGQATKLHNHHDIEVFIVIAGVGEITIDGAARDLAPGDIIRLLPLQSHVIANHKTTNLVLCNFWWNDVAYLKQAVRINHSTESKIHIILPSFITPNGNLHIGHIAGPLLAADIAHRVMSLYKQDKIFLSGTIGYQTQVEVTAKKLNRSYSEAALLYSNNIHGSIQRMNINPDVFLTLEREAKLQEVSFEYIRRIMQHEAFCIKDAEVFYCTSCEEHLFEANIVGECPHCSHKVNAECENCFTYFAEKELCNPRCANCNSVPTLKSITRMFFDLEQCRHVIVNLCQTNAFSCKSREFVEKILSKPLPTIPLGVVAKNGTSLAQFGFPNQVIYSAVELTPRFLAAFACHADTAQFDMDWEQWLIKKEIQLNVFFGVDNAYLRCIMFPILLSAYNKQLVNTMRFYINEFYSLEGHKFSTSRNHVLSVEYLAAKYPIDHIRYYLAMHRPEHSQTSFTEKNFKDFCANSDFSYFLLIWEVIKGHLTVANRVDVPEAGAWDAQHKAFQALLDANIALCQQMLHPNGLHIAEYCRSVNYLMLQVCSFYHDMIAYNHNNAYARTTMALLAKAVVSIAILLYPITPDLATNIYTFFYPGQMLDIAKLNVWIPARTVATPIALQELPAMSMQYAR